mmetsp:Transcript_67030/g.187158  ORF Transcript_67030/g.187158 Transcript_67030/m.187158 type:complete len:227 (-) Transcript_67030:974-1654(-)
MTVASWHHFYAYDAEASLRCIRHAFLLNVLARRLWRRKPRLFADGHNFLERQLIPREIVEALPGAVESEKGTCRNDRWGSCFRLLDQYSDHEEHVQQQGEKDLLERLDPEEASGVRFLRLDEHLQVTIDRSANSKTHPCQESDHWGARAQHQRDRGDDNAVPHPRAHSEKRLVLWLGILLGDLWLHGAEYPVEPVRQKVAMADNLPSGGKPVEDEVVDVEMRCPWQ